MEHVVVIIGAGQIGQAIARRVGIGKHVVLADRSEANENAAAEVMTNAGYQVSVATVDVSSRDTVRALVGKATGLGEIVGLIHAAGVSPSQASPDTILHVDLYGTAVVLEEFGSVMAHGGSGVVISSQSGHRLPALTVEQNKALAMTPTEELLKLPFLQLDQVKDSLHAYRIVMTPLARTNSLGRVAQGTDEGRGEQRMETTKSGSQPSAKGPADWFTGAVRIDSRFQRAAPARIGGATVTFEPGARTAWHTHPLGQTLIVTAGCGRVQRDGGPIEEIRAGDIVWFEPGERHWHGASPTTAMTHIAIAEMLDGKAVEWMEHVTDEQYGR
jgi:quercetin dioxygenase-like cupin family protein